jgi:hypothetical protein
MTDIEKEVLSKFQFPLWYDDSGQYIFDTNNQMVLDVRAYGHLKSVELQDALGRWIADGLNKIFYIESIVTVPPLSAEEYIKQRFGIEEPSDMESIGYNRWLLAMEEYAERYLRHNEPSVMIRPLPKDLTEKLGDEWSKGGAIVQYQRKSEADLHRELTIVDNALDDADRINGDAPHRAVDRATRIKVLAGHSDTIFALVKKAYERGGAEEGAYWDAFKQENNIR